MRIFAACLLAIFSSLSLLAQDCKSYYVFTKDAEVEMTVYDSKGGSNGKQTWKIDEITQESSTLKSNVKTSFTDKKGKDGAKTTGTYRCNNGVIQVDMKMFLPQEQMEAYKNMEVKADEVFIEYPSTMTEGQSLNDGDFKMEIFNKGTLSSTITMKMTNRKVSGKESVTTPAGNWDAYKITYDGQFKAMIGSSGMGIPMNFKVTEWYAPGFGTVKTETYNKNGKLLGSTAITSIKK